MTYEFLISHFSTPFLHINRKLFWIFMNLVKYCNFDTIIQLMLVKTRAESCLIELK